MKEVLDQRYVRLEWYSNRSFTPYGDNLFKAELIHFREVDDMLRLPPGTAKRFLAEVVERYGEAFAIQEFENSVRFWSDKSVR